MLNRRDAMLRLGQTGLGMLTLPGLLGAESNRLRSASAPRLTGKSRSCIYLFLWGGPPQQDLWDMKPDAPSGVRSQFGVIQTATPGIIFSDQMPRLAQLTGKLAVVRSLTHGSNNHEPSVYHMLTGKQDPTLAVPRNQRRRGQAPFFGSVLSSFCPPGALPACVTVPRPIGHDGVTYAGTHAGWMGPRFDPLELKEAPGANEKPVAALTLSADLDTARLQARRGLLRLIEEQDRLLQGNRTAEALDDFADQALRLLSSSAARRAFDLDREPPSVRDRYGRNEYGESMLLARRLVESGVRLVSVIWMYIFPTGRVSNVWDNHAGYGIHGAKTGYDLLKGPVCLLPLDQGLSALLQDLDDRGLLDETLVVAAGEFGRTPRINSTGGRDHWGACQSILLAGGGVRGGQVYGSTDSQSAYVKDHPVSPEDLLATIYHAFGLEPAQEIHDRENRPHRLCDGRPITAVFG